jgi:hypothetical protein
VQDDTTGIQSAFTYIATTGGCLYFPVGTYLISSAISVGQIVGCRILGESRAGVTLKQATSNTQHFTFTTCDTHSFTIDGFTFVWSSQQTSANTSANAIYFAGTSGTVANGFYNFVISNCLFSKGFRSIFANSGVGLAVWGYKVEHCVHASTMVGGFFRYDPTPSIGTPGVKFDNIYVDATGLSEPAFYMTSLDAPKFSGINIGNGTIGGAGKPAAHIQLTSCVGISIENCSEETVTIDSVSGFGIWILASCTGRVASVKFATISYTAGSFYGAILANSTSFIGVDGFTMSLGTVGGGATTAMFLGDYDYATNYKWSGSAGSYTFYATATCRSKQIITGSATYDPANLVDGAGATTTVTVTGAVAGDYVEGVSFSNDLQGITLTGYVSGADTVSVRFQNESGGALDLASGTLRARVRPA